MKKVFLFALIAVLFAACNKKEENMVLPEAEVSFSINESINDGLKSATVDDWVCPSDDQGNLLEPAYAEITIGGTLYTTDVYRLDGKLYTQSIKLGAADATATTYSVSKFLLYSADNVLIRATPEEGSEYAEYVNQPVPFNIDVNAFEKAEIPIEVLCFMPQNYTYFGFTWFASTEIAVREVCFFGDICLNGEPFAPSDFNGSLYGSNVGVDVPAIMKIIVKRNGVEVPNSPFKNIDALNSPLCVQYPDILNVDGEAFTFELQLWLPDGNGFSYQTYATYTATDDGALDIDAGVDGIVDFVVGTCGVEGVADATFDFLYAPHFVLTDPSEQNPINQTNDKPWYSYEVNGLCIEFTLHNPTNFPAWFDFQIDGNPGTFVPGTSDILITQGILAGTQVGNLYSNTKVLPGQTVVDTRCGSNEIKVATHFGPEQQWYLDWATFTAN